MTVRQIIQEIETLPPEEKLRVKAFFAQEEQASDVVRYADCKKAMDIADKIFSERADLFQKLAQ
jgi:hypothetical protein